MTTKNPFPAGGPPGGGPTPPDGKGPDPGADAGAGPGDGWAGKLHVPPDPERDLACARLPLTDLGNAERWRVRHGQDFRFCAEIGWFAWDDLRWKQLSEEKDALPAAVMQSVFATVRAIRNEAALVAASGYPPATGMSDKQLRELESWAEAEKATSWDMYVAQARRAHDGLRGRFHGIDPDDSEARVGEWLAALEPMDVVVDFKKGGLWSTAIAKWAKTSEGAGKLLSVAKLAKAFADIAIEPGQLDADRMAINCLNGTLRLVPNTRKLSAAERQARIEAGKGDAAFLTEGLKIKRFAHRREDLITKLAPVKYLPNATCPAFDAFLQQVQPDDAMRAFLDQWGGYSLIGDTTEHKLAFFHGGGRNGKGTWVEAVAWLAGDYAGSIGIESLIETGGKRRGDQATPDIAALPGVRFLRVSEPEKGMSFNDGLIKQFTGGDPVKARHLNKGFFEFFPDFKITVSGNTKPKVKDLSHGMWSRMQLVPWEVTIAEDAIDRTLPDKLKAEASGILNRLLAGLIEQRRHGLIVPEQVKLATRAYRDSSDDLGRFLSAICVVSDDHDRVRCGAQELYDLYCAWASAAGGSEWKIKGFKGAMEDKGFVQKPSNGMKWLGVQPKPGIDLEAVKRGEWPDDPEEWASGEGGDWAPDDDPPAGWA